MSDENSVLNDILREYDERRLYNQLFHKHRVKEVHDKVPEIASIDNQIRDLAMNAALEKIENPDAVIDDEQLKAITADLIRQKKSLLKANGFPNDYLEPIYDCASCKDTGFVTNGKCNCLKKKLIHYQYEQSGLAAQLSSDDFSTFRLDYYSDEEDGVHPLPSRQNMEHVYQALLEYTEHSAEADYARKSILLSGSTGVGKTYLTNCLAKRLLDKGYTVFYISATNLFDTLKDEILNHSFRENTIPTSELVNTCDYLIIDDLGTELNTSFAVTHMYNIINTRMQARKSVIISTNLSIEDLEDRYTERVSSRIYEDYQIYFLYGADIRVAKREGTLPE